VFWVLNKNNFNPKILYPEKLSFKIDKAIKIFHNKQTKTIYDHEATTREDSLRKSAQRR
jgi:hypothetical protein